MKNYNQGKLTAADVNRQRARNMHNNHLQKKADAIDDMTPEEVKDWLKSKRLPVFGTNKERLERLKKALGIAVESSNKAKGSCVDKIGAIAQRRELRRRKTEEEVANKAAKAAENKLMGREGDVEFISMIESFKDTLPQPQRH